MPSGASPRGPAPRRGPPAGRGARIARLFGAALVGGTVAGTGAALVAVVAAFAIPESWPYEVFGVTPLLVVGGVWLGASVAMTRATRIADLRSRQVWEPLGVIAAAGVVSWVAAAVVLPGVIPGLAVAVVVPLFAGAVWVARRS